MNLYELIFREDSVPLNVFCECWLDSLSQRHIPLSSSPRLRSVEVLFALGERAQALPLWVLRVSVWLTYSVQLFQTALAGAVTFCSESELRMPCCSESDS